MSSTTLVETERVLQVPENGLVVYTGTILTEDGKEKKVNIDFEPFKPINTSLYLCDNKFHTQVPQFLRLFAFPPQHAASVDGCVAQKTLA